MRLRVVIAIAAGIALATPARASEPGQPLDCSDWVALAPGITCSTFAGRGTVGDWNSPWIMRGTNLVADNEGHLIIVRKNYADPRTA